jgi:site-specific DNA-methyltransferase (adenine-specific)
VGLPSPYYQDDWVTIYHGDCRDLLPHITADIAVTDPPYNAAKNYGAHDDAMTRGEYVAWCHEWFDMLPDRRIIFPGVGNQWVWADKQPKAVACWYKPGNPGGGGPFQFCEWEPILLWGVNFKLGDVFHVSISTQPDTGDHPCPKPLRLMRSLLERLRTPGSIVDPFAGSGSTLRAAKDLGRNSIGIELEERFCEIAAKRCAQEVLDLEAA